MSRLIELADCILRRCRASDIAPNDPLNLIFAPHEDFRDDSNLETRNVELRCGRTAKIVKVQIFIGNAGHVLCIVEG